MDLPISTEGGQCDEKQGHWTHFTQSGKTLSYFSEMLCLTEQILQQETMYLDPLSLFHIHIYTHRHIILFPKRLLTTD